jgi:hypothetical protein
MENFEPREKWSMSSGVVLSFDFGGSHVAAMAARVEQPFQPNQSIPSLERRWFGNISI